jgi:integrase
MKAGRPHVVPLSPEAISVFKAAEALRVGASTLIFPGARLDQPLSDMTLVKVVRDMGVDATPHGFRSSFRDWAAEQTSFPAEVAEAALAHAVSDKVVAAYRRTDFLEKRRSLMEAWGSYCAGRPTRKLRAVS